tara:strand:+ start:40402 stop:40692 length:291 start_codon:yes stop_codon:yes gene_type:complete
MKADLIMIRAAMMDFRARLGLEAAVLLAVLGALAWYGAPTWAHVLAIYVGTRTARVDHAADTAALQSTYHVRLKAIEVSVDKMIDRFDRWKIGPKQ